MNTVGKYGTLGGSIRCVVSVSMLTEGWDTNTVTHILGVRAFGLEFVNPLGMAAGFDKNAEVARALRPLTSRQLIVAGGIREQSEIDALEALGVDAVAGMAVYSGLLVT